MLRRLIQMGKMIGGHMSSSSSAHNSWNMVDGISMDTCILGVMKSHIPDLLWKTGSN